MKSHFIMTESQSLKKFHKFFHPTISAYKIELVAHNLTLNYDFTIYSVAPENICLPVVLFGFYQENENFFYSAFLKDFQRIHDMKKFIKFFQLLKIKFLYVVLKKFNKFFHQLVSEKHQNQKARNSGS